MFKIFISLISIFYFSLCFAETPNHIKKLTPKGWNVLYFSEGDLNQDNQADIAMIVQSIYSSKIERKLIIFFKTDNNFKTYLNKDLNSWTINSEKDCIGDAFDEESLEIQNQVLNLRFNDVPICSNTYGINYNYKFKYINNEFHLIGFDEFSADKLSGNIIESSINFRTLKAKITTYNLNQDINIETKNIWKNLSNRQHFNLEQMSFIDDNYNPTFKKQFGL